MGRLLGIGSGLELLTYVIAAHIAQRDLGRVRARARAGVRVSVRLRVGVEVRVRVRVGVRVRVRVRRPPAASLRPPWAGRSK